MKDIFGMSFQMRLAAAVMSLAFAVSAHGQAFDTGQISGLARDATASVIPGVTITVMNQAQGQERQTITNEQGYYVFPNLAVGPYTVTAELPGFRKFVKTGIQLSAAASIRVDIALTVGDVSEVIEVQAMPNEVVAETSALGHTVTERDISQLLVSGRNPLLSVALKAGVAGANLGAYMGDGFGGGGYSINGGRPGEYLATVDGAALNRNRQGAIINGAQDLDTVAEIQVLTANYSAEYGRASSGVVRLVTKSGTQEFHGKLVHNLQNDKLDANTWSRNASGSPRLSEVPPRKVNQFGFSIGGPIFIPGKFNSDRKKLFFFAAEEWVYRRQENTITSTVPSLAMRNGDFSELLSLNNTFFPGRTRVVTDPVTRQPFPNNVIPPGRFSPNGQALLRVYPEPMPGFLEGTANYIGTRPVWSNTRKDTYRIDYMITDRHTLAWRATNIKNNYNQPFIRHSYEWNIPSKSTTLSLVSSLSPTFINEFTFTGTLQGPQDLSIDPECGSVISDGRGGPDRCMKSTYGLDYPLLFPGTKWAPEKLPTIQIAGLSTLDLGPYPGRTTDWIFTFGNNMTKVVRNHTVKWGVLIEHSGQNDRIQFTTATPPSTNNQNGSFRFFDSRPNATGFAPANALLGYFDDYSEFGDKPVTPYIATAWDFFVQDSWKATRRLTVEAGIRYSLWPPWQSRWGTLAMFRPDYYDPAQAPVIDRTGGFVVSGDRFNGMVLPGCGPSEDALGRFPFLPEFERLYHCLPDGFAQTHKDGFQPRLGLAFSLNDKTAVRAGGGMFLQRNQISSSAAFGGQAPLMEQQTVINGIVDSPTGAERRNFPLTVFTLDPMFKTPTAWTWNATIERELPATTRLSVSYVGRRGHYNSRLRNINQLPAGAIFDNPGVNANFLRPYQGMGVINLLENASQSRYNGLQITAERRASGLGFSASYTLSRSKDDASALTTVLPNAFDAKSFYGISDFDRTHTFVLNAMYDFPSLSGRPAGIRWFFGGWGLVSITQIQSGTPFTVQFSQDYAGIGPGGGAQLWNQTGDSKIERTEFTTSAVWFNKDAFARPANGTFGVQERNALRNPGGWDANLSVHRRFQVTEGQRVEFRWEAFNVFNHPGLANANSNPTSGSFGLVTSKNGNRTMQVNLQYVF